MKRGPRNAIIAVAVAAGLAGWYLAKPGEVPQAVPEAPAPRTAAVAAPTPMPAAAAPVPAVPDGDGLRRVPIAPVDARTPAWISMAQARESGDERTPPIQRTAPAEHPDASVLADHDAYASYQLEQKQRLAAAYVQAAAPELGKLHADLERGREAGVPPEELARVAEKIRRIEQQRQAADAMLANSKGQ